ncbi:hypothetical protein TrRE_jg14, partial [Triparma retinervis]
RVKSSRRTIERATTEATKALESYEADEEDCDQIGEERPPKVLGDDLVGLGRHPVPRVDHDVQPSSKCLVLTMTSSPVDVMVSLTCS